jgi:hypothetical protein
VRFGGGLRGELIAHDGRPLRDTSQRPSPPISVMTDKLALGAAERYDLRLHPPAGAIKGDTFAVTVDFLNWITGAVLGTQTATVEVI